MPHCNSATQSPTCLHPNLELATSTHATLRPAMPCLQIGGMRLAFDPRRPDRYDRLVDAVLSEVEGRPSLRSYGGDILLLTTNFLASGGDK